MQKAKAFFLWVVDNQGFHPLYSCPCVYRHFFPVFLLSLSDLWVWQSTSAQQSWCLQHSQHSDREFKSHLLSAGLTEVRETACGSFFKGKVSGVNPQWQNTEEKKTQGKDALVWTVSVPSRHGCPASFLHAITCCYTAVAVLSVGWQTRSRAIPWQEWNKDLWKQCPISRVIYLICVCMFSLHVWLCTVCMPSVLAV